MKEQVNRTIKINAGIACLDRADEVEPRPNEGTPYRHCEGGTTEATEFTSSTQSIPNNQCVFGQGLLRCARNDGVMGCLFGFSHSFFRASAHFQFSIFNFQLTKGIACLDRANEVEPRPNEGFPYRHCEERSDVAIPNNQRVFGQGYVFNPANLVNPINHGSDKSADNISFAALAMTALWVAFLAFHTTSFLRQFIFNFQFSIFN